MLKLYSRRRLKKKVHVSTVGDGRLGFPEGAPYDAIHVGAAAATVPKAVRTLIVWIFYEI